MTTSTIIQFGTNAIQLKDAISSIYIQSGNIQSFSNPSDLEGITSPRPVATYEDDWWLLNGNYKFAPATGTIPIGLLSTDLSDSDKIYNDPTVLAVELDAPKTITGGITLHFTGIEGEYPDALLIKYYNSIGGLIWSGTVFPDNENSHYIDQSASGVQKITIEWSISHKPYRYARLSGIDLDDILIFSGSSIKDATLTEEISPLSVELPINTLDFTLFSTSGTFSVVNPQGMYANLKYKQPLDAYALIDAVPEYLGRFYLDEWTSKSANEASFKSSDLIGVLDKVPYRFRVPSLVIFVGWTIGDLLAYVLPDADIPYTIDATVAARTISGYIPNVSTREALQHILFAGRAYATCSRSNVLNIYDAVIGTDLSSPEIDFTIDETDKSLESPIEVRRLVTGVEVKSHSYAADGKIDTTIFNSSLASGTYVLEFQDPHYFYQVSGAVINSYTGNTVSITVTTPGTVSLTAGGYIDSPYIYGVYNNSLPTGTQSNILQINDATMVYPDYVATVAQRLYDYYAQRYLQNTTLYGSIATVGNAIDVHVEGQELYGVVERAVTNLSGFRTTLKIVGETI